MCFGIRISSPFHLATQIIPFKNPNFPKMKITHVRTWFLECPPADYPNVKLLVQLADVGRWRWSHARWRQPVATKATVPDTQSRQHMVLEEAVVPKAVQVGRAFQKLKEHSKKHVCAAFNCVFRTVWILNGYNLNG